MLREKLSNSELELKSGNLNKSSEKFHKYSKKMEGTESKVEFKHIVKKQWILKQLESIGKFVLKNYWLRNQLSSNQKIQYRMSLKYLIKTVQLTLRSLVCEQNWTKCNLSVKNIRNQLFFLWYTGKESDGNQGKHQNWVPSIPYTFFLDFLIHCVLF